MKVPFTVAFSLSVDRAPSGGGNGRVDEVKVKTVVS